MSPTRRRFTAMAATSLGLAARPARAETRLPDGACDCHVHVVGPPARYPMVPDRTYTPPEASVADLVAFRRRHGLARSVIVQPSFYGTDNRCMLDALAELGDSARGVAVLSPEVTLGELRDLDRRGVRGVRLNLETGGHRDPAAASAALSAFADRLAPVKWHLQIYAALPVIAEVAGTIAKLPVPVVVDHYGAPTPSAGVDHADFRTLLGLVRTSDVYVKLSAPYRASTQADGGDLAPFARALVAAAPERMLWASDWPHTDRVPGRAATEIHPYRPIDDAAVLRTFRDWLPDEATAHRIFVDNPQRLYRF